MHRLVPLAVLLLASGCVVPGPAAPSAPAALATQDAAPVVGPPSEVALASDCGRLVVQANPPAFRQGEPTRVRARFENCGQAAIERSAPCLGGGWRAEVWIDDESWELADGSARQDLLCPAMVGRWRAEPGEVLRENWTWNGTLIRCAWSPANRTSCVTREVPPGTYSVGVTLSGWSREREGATESWRVDLAVRVLPR